MAEIKKEMMFTEYVCEGLAEDVKQVVISVRDFHVRRPIHDAFYMATKDQAIDLVKQAEHYAKRELMEGLEKFVKVDANLERNFIEAVIWMPYVKDDLVESLEETERRQMTEIMCLRGENAYMAKRIKYLELPWWKKLHLWIKGRVK